MMINAKEKIMNIINELLPMDNSIELDQYRNKTAVLLFSKLSYYKNINELLKKYDHENLQYAIDIYTYPNGLIRLESYCILNGEYVISQTIITESLYDEYDEAIIEVYNKYELKTVQQFFIKSSTPNLLFGTPSNKDRNIEINRTSISIKGMCAGVFTKIGKKNSSIVYSEKYTPLYRILVNELNIPENAIDLEILYGYDDTPVYAQLLYDESERARRLYGESKLLAVKKLSDHITPNSFVNNVNCEVNAIIKKIEAIINEYNINDNFVKSLQKK